MDESIVVVVVVVAAVVAVDVVVVVGGGGGVVDVTGKTTLTGKVGRDRDDVIQIENY